MGQPRLWPDAAHQGAVRPRGAAQPRRAAQLRPGHPRQASEADAARRPAGRHVHRMRLLRAGLPQPPHDAEPAPAHRRHPRNRAPAPDRGGPGAAPGARGRLPVCRHGYLRGVQSVLAALSGGHRNRHHDPRRARPPAQRCRPRQGALGRRSYRRHRTRHAAGRRRPGAQPLGRRRRPHRRRRGGPAQARRQGGAARVEGTATRPRRTPAASGCRRPRSTGPRRLFSELRHPHVRRAADRARPAADARRHGCAARPRRVRAGGARAPCRPVLRPAVPVQGLPRGGRARRRPPRRRTAAAVGGGRTAHPYRCLDLCQAHARRRRPRRLRQRRLPRRRGAAAPHRHPTAAGRRRTPQLLGPAPQGAGGGRDAGPRLRRAHRRALLHHLLRLCRRQGPVRARTQRPRHPLRDLGHPGRLRARRIDRRHLRHRAVRARRHPLRVAGTPAGTGEPAGRGGITGMA